MINVSYGLKDGHYTYIEVKGHALYADYGKDIICASVSSIIFGLMNCLSEKDNIHIKKTDNKIVIKNDSKLNDIDNYIKLTIIQLKTIEQSYNEFIKVERK